MLRVPCGPLFSPKWFSNRSASTRASWVACALPIAEGLNESADRHQELRRNDAIEQLIDNVLSDFRHEGR